MMLLQCNRCKRSRPFEKLETVVLNDHDFEHIFLCRDCMESFYSWLHEYEDDDEPPHALTAEEIEIRDRILSISYPAQTEITADSDGLKIKIPLKKMKKNRDE